MMIRRDVFTFGAVSLATFLILSLFAWAIYCSVIDDTLRLVSCANRADTAVGKIATRPFSGTISYTSIRGTHVSASGCWVEQITE